jgi:kinesin family protein 6/9
MGQARLHVPYRNSMMTTVLRDSLGGNCRTVMVANINGASAHVDESISTCRFAERVAMICNTVSHK